MAKSELELYHLFSTQMSGVSPNVHHFPGVRRVLFVTCILVGESSSVRVAAVEEFVPKLDVLILE